MVFHFDEMGFFMKLKDNNGKFFPKFAYIPVIFIIIFNLIAYTGTKFLTLNANHYDFTTRLDEIIPFVPWFMLFYVLAYVQWVWNYVYHTRLGRGGYYHMVTADLIAKVFCFVLFLVFPATIVRPEVTGNGFWDHVTRLIYYLDTPTSLLPSIHCVESWLCFRAACMVKDAPRWYAPAQFVFTLLVFASTVLVKQHFVVDILAGIAVLEIGWFLSKRFKLWRVFYKFEPASVQKECANEDILL